MLPTRWCSFMASRSLLPGPLIILCGLTTHSPWVRCNTLLTPCLCVCSAAGPLTIQQALTYFGGAVASTIGLVTCGTLLALLRKRLRQKGK